MGIQARIAASQYLSHLMATNDSPYYPGSSALTHIDAVILAALTVDEEHQYRLAHHHDVAVVEYLAGSAAS